ncbi:MAG: sugar ABC transporter ATP-binding protein [bacterium]
MKTNDDFLVLRNVSKSFSGVQALFHVNFTIKKGEVHCLVGENGSGKSTLIKIIAGNIQPDPGCEIIINNKPFRKITNVDSMNEGIQVIYQDLSLFPNLTVAENISINQYLEENKKIITRKDLERIASESIKKIGAELEPSALVGELPIAKQQLVAICRAITRGEKLIIMDEPTSSLGKKDIDSLFSVIKTLKERGISVLFVGHKLNEIFEIADRVTILRDGKIVGTFNVEELNNEKLIELMTGRKVSTSQYLKPNNLNEKVLLKVKNLTKEGQFKNISFKLHAGEILGLTGLVGSGRTELALAIFGLNKPDSGEIYIENTSVKINSINDAINLGIGYLPENRLIQGLFMEHSISKNMIVTIIEKLVNQFLLLDRKRVRSINDTWIKELDIKTPSPELTVKQLSGGNQQRVVLAKWLARNPKILLLDGPTIGIDVGAKEEIHSIIKNLASNGMGILMISDEVSEVVHHSHRILVMKEGQISNEFYAEDITESELIKELGEK